MTGEKSMKDFAKSWEQKSWEFAVSRYERMKGMANSKHDSIREYAIKAMGDLEREYPGLLTQ
jgi:hypothetical protein